MTTNETLRPWAAGIWEQNAEADGGDGLVVWSRHAREDLAIAAARRYARAKTQPTGGALSWCGGIRAPDGSVRWYAADGTLWWDARTRTGACST